MRRKVDFSLLPEDKRVMKSDFHVVKERIAQYDMIIDCDLWIELEISTNQIRCDESVFHLSDSEKYSTMYLLSMTAYLQSVTQSTSSIQRILDAKYEPANLDEIVKSSSHLDENEKKVVSSCLHEHEELFNGTLGK